MKAVFDKFLGIQLLHEHSSDLDSRYVNITGDTMTGNLLLGTNKLQTAVIYPSADSTTAIQFNKADGITNVVTIDTTNARVGIGTTSPVRPLYSVYTSSVTNSNEPGLASVRHTSGTPAAGLGAAVEFYVQGSTGVDEEAAKIAGVLTTVTHGAVDSALLFYTRNNNSAFTEQMRIDNNGNVGIGTTNPLQKLHVAGVDAKIIVQDTTQDDSSNAINGEFAFGYPPDASLLLGGMRLLRGAAAGNGYNGFATVLTGILDGGSMTNVLYAGGNGNVGIGTTAPTAVLHLKAGSDVSGGAPLKLTSGTLTTGANITAGAVEFLTDRYYLTTTTSAIRQKIQTLGVLALSAGSATPAINTDIYNVVHITAQSAAITSFTTNLTGTPIDGEALRISITDDGTGRAITWGAKFEASTIALPTTTVASTRLDVSFVWNTETSKFRCVGVA